MKNIKACLKLYNDKDDHTNRYANRQPGDIDPGVPPVSDQTPQRGSEIIFKHHPGFALTVCTH
jgi:hypothetical protein